MITDTPKAIHFAAFDHSGRELPRFDRRGLDVRWLAARCAERRGIDFLRPLRLADLTAVMEACAEAGAACGLRVRLCDDELARLREGGAQ